MEDQVSFLPCRIHMMGFALLLIQSACPLDYAWADFVRELFPRQRALRLLLVIPCY